MYLFRGGTFYQRSVLAPSVITLLLLGLWETRPVQAAVLNVYPPQGIANAVYMSAPNDTILVHPGVYTLEMRAQIEHPLTVIGVGGATRNEVRICVDMCGGPLFHVAPNAGRVVVDGLTLTRNRDYTGGTPGIIAEGWPDLTIQNCIFWELQGYGVILAAGRSVHIERNLFLDYMGADLSGGTPVFRGNTFILSSINLRNEASPYFESNLFYSANAVVCEQGSSPLFACNDAWESIYVGCSDPTGTNGNFRGDPLFCDPGTGDYHLRPGSPCLPENAPPGCGLIGALGICELNAVGQGAPATQGVLRVQPNPILTSAEFSFGDDAIIAPVEIFDLQGRLIQVLIPANRRVFWIPDASVPRGVYFARLGGPTLSQAVKLSVVR